MPHSSTSDVLPAKAESRTVNIWLIVGLVVSLGFWLGVGFVVQLII